MADLFDGYSLGEQWDEMFGGVSEPRAAYAGLFASLQPMAGDELAADRHHPEQRGRRRGLDRPGVAAHATPEQEQHSPARDGVRTGGHVPAPALAPDQELLRRTS